MSVDRKTSFVGHAIAEAREESGGYDTALLSSILADKLMACPAPAIAFTALIEALIRLCVTEAMGRTTCDEAFEDANTYILEALEEWIADLSDEVEDLIKHTHGGV